VTSPSTLIPAVTTPSVLIAVTVTWALVAAMWDLRTHRIPNWMTFPAALLGLALNLALEGSFGLRQSVLGALAGLGMLIVPFAMGGMGAGDVKMLAAVGAFGGPAFAFSTFLYGSIAGGLIALALMLVRSRSMDRARATKMVFPYGVAILAGAIATSVARWL